MVGPLGVVVSPFRPSSRIEGRGPHHHVRRRNVGVVTRSLIRNSLILIENGWKIFSTLCTVNLFVLDSTAVFASKILAFINNIQFMPI